VNARQAAWIEEQRAEKQKQTSAEAASRGRGAEAAETAGGIRKDIADSRNQERLTEAQLKAASAEHIAGAHDAVKLKIAQGGNFFKAYAADRAAGKDPDAAELKKWAKSVGVSNNDAIHGFNDWLFKNAGQAQQPQQQAPAPIQGQGGGAEGSPSPEAPPANLSDIKPNTAYATVRGPGLFVNGRMVPAQWNGKAWVPAAAWEK
jgi:hypothetical protein